MFFKRIALLAFVDFFLWLWLTTKMGFLLGILWRFAFVFLAWAAYRYIISGYLGRMRDLLTTPDARDGMSELDKLLPLKAHVIFLCFVFPGPVTDLIGLWLFARILIGSERPSWWKFFPFGGDRGAGTAPADEEVSPGSRGSVFGDDAPGYAGSERDEAAIMRGRYGFGADQVVIDASFTEIEEDGKDKNASEGGK